MNPSSLADSQQAPAALGRGRPYGAQVRFYDAEYRDATADIEFFIRRLRDLRVNGPLLDLGCGTGRITISLAAAGFSVLGIDLSQPLLGRARRRLRKLSPAVAARLHFRRADICSFVAPQPFAAVLAPFSVFNMLLEPADRRACLACCQAHLQPGGLLWIDVLAPRPNPQIQFGRKRIFSHRFRLPPHGHFVDKSVAEQVSDDGQHIDMTYFYEVSHPADGRRLDTLQVDVRLARLTRADLEPDLYAAGFDVEAVYGDYFLHLPGPRSPRLIFEARRL